MFRDRVDAGRQLADKLGAYYAADAVVLALPRGGVVLGAEVAKTLRVPLDLIIARKIGHPQEPEYAIGAVAEFGEPIYNEAECARIDRDWLQRAVQHARDEARRQRETYLVGRSSTPWNGKILILVDDGIATGLTMRAAIRAAQAQRPRDLIVAIPVIPPQTVEVLQREGVLVIAVDIPPVFHGAVGAYYQDFHPVADEEVQQLLHSHIS
jgi:predicted phosphoribosyltransferase